MSSLAKILLPVDFSERTAGAARYAGNLAAHCGSEIILVHVLPPLHTDFGAEIAGSMLVDVYRTRCDQATRELASFLSAELAGIPVRRLVLHGDPSTEIVRVAHAESVGLIAMPTHGYGPFRRFILGSNTAKVLHDADCPVWTGVHMEAVPASSGPLRRILCAIDLGPHSAATLRWAAWLAREFAAELAVIHAVAGHAAVATEPDTSWRAGLLEAAEEEILMLQRDSGVEAGVLLESGEPAMYHI